MAHLSVLKQTTGTADIVEQQRLNLTSEDRVMRVTRLRSDGDRPLSYEVAVLPLGRLPGPASEYEGIDDIVALARQHRFSLGRATEGYNIVHVPRDVAEQLGIDPDASVFKLDRIVELADGMPIEWRISFVVKLQ